jgi:glycosyltransferase involved in cell wall biosynthesis
MDADGQHDPTELSKIVEPILSGKADMVIGTRLKESNGMPLIRRIGVWGFNAITYLLFGVWTTDSHSGFRAFSRRALDVMEFNLRGMEVSPGFFAEVERHRLRFAEVPIRAIYTDYSVTKGQRPLRSAFAILFRLLWHKLIK